MRFKIYYNPRATVVYNPVTANLFNAHYSPLFTGLHDDIGRVASYGIGRASNFDSIITYIKDLYDWKNVIEIKYIDEDELYVVTLQDKRANSSGMRKKLELIVIPEPSKYFNFDLLNEGENIFSIFRAWINDNANS